MLNPGQFERRVTATGMVALLGAFVFLGALSYWQIFRTDLADKPTNPRILAEFVDPGRGSILDREGNVLAESLPDGTRRYTDASVAHAVGYIHPRYGSQGAELAFNGYLSGEKAASWREAFNTELLRKAERGLDVRLTIDPAIQAAATEALAGRSGAVVALDPKSGEVLAMVSVPTYDPGSLDETGEALLADPSAPLLNRAAQGLYPPGSTFKAVTAAAVLEHGIIQPDTTVTCPGEIVVEGFPISCSNVPQGVGTYPFRDAFAYSVNAIFAEVGVDLGWPGLIDTSRKFGFGRALDFTLDTAPSQVHNEDSDLSAPLLASTAFGQGELLATPLQMAAVAAAIANDGVLMRPHLGLAAYDGNRKVANLEEPSGRRVLDPRVAAIMRDFMVSVIDNGQAGGVAIEGVSVGGKTGTAESGTEGFSHAWFIAFAPADDPVIAVAVVVEDGGQGGVVASPIAGQVIRAALAR